MNGHIINLKIPLEYMYPICMVKKLYINKQKMH